MTGKWGWDVHYKRDGQGWQLLKICIVKRSIYVVRVDKHWSEVSLSVSDSFLQCCRTMFLIGTVFCFFYRWRYISMFLLCTLHTKKCTFYMTLLHILQDIVITPSIRQWFLIYCTILCLIVCHFFLTGTVPAPFFPCKNPPGQQLTLTTGFLGIAKLALW